MFEKKYKIRGLEFIYILCNIEHDLTYFCFGFEKEYLKNYQRSFSSLNHPAKSASNRKLPQEIW
jgi:hypothetical protein